MANLTILRTYALKDPAKLPASILFSHSDKTLTIYDAYPKSIFHFLVLPRVLESSAANSDPDNSSTRHLNVSDLSSLRTLLNSKDATKEEAKEVILSLRDEARRMTTEIETEMENRYGFVWGVWIGFHASPSMEHLHLHILSADLCSERVKIKKHYNSFHPKLGFFLDVDEVLSWFDAEPSYYQTMAKLPSTTYEPLLKESLSCFHCNSEQKNMPMLKNHLKEEWEKLQTQAESRKKRKLDLTEDQGAPSPPAASAKSENTEPDESRDASPAHKRTKRDSL